MPFVEILSYDCVYVCVCVMGVWVCGILSILGFFFISSLALVVVGLRLILF